MDNTEQNNKQNLTQQPYTEQLTIQQDHKIELQQQNTIVNKEILINDSNQEENQENQIEQVLPVENKQNSCSENEKKLLSPKQFSEKSIEENKLKKSNEIIKSNGIKLFNNGKIVDSDSEDDQQPKRSRLVERPKELLQKQELLKILDPEKYSNIEQVQVVQNIEYPIENNEQEIQLQHNESQNYQIKSQEIIKSDLQENEQENKQENKLQDVMETEQVNEQKDKIQLQEQINSQQIQQNENPYLIPIPQDSIKQQKLDVISSQQKSQKGILGLNLKQDDYNWYYDRIKSLSNFQILDGERMIHIYKGTKQKYIQCEHNLILSYLKMPQELDQGQAQNAFKAIHNIQGTLVLTNYRLLFVQSDLQKDSAAGGFVNSMLKIQPSFYHDFFNVPLGYVMSIDKYTPNQGDKDQKGIKQFQNIGNTMVNLLEVHTKDN